MDIDVKKLHPLEVKLLRHVSLGEKIDNERIISELGYKVGQCNQAFSWLSQKQLLKEVERSVKVVYELTDYGRSLEKEGLPAERIFTFLGEKGPHTMPEIAEALNMENSDVGSAFGSLSSKKAVALNAERKAERISDELPAEIRMQRALIERALSSGEIEESALSSDEKKAISQMAKNRGAILSPFKLSAVR